MEVRTLVRSLEQCKKQINVRTNLMRELDRRTQGSVPPNAELYLYWNTSVGSLKHRIWLLILVSWYVKTEVRFYLQANLEDFEIKKLPPEDRTLCKTMLRSKLATLEILASRWSERDWFGNQLPNLLRLVPSLQFQWNLPRKPKRQVYRRGYRDHGALRPSHKWLADSDWSFTELQNQIELERKQEADAIAIAEGFFE